MPTTFPSTDFPEHAEAVNRWLRATGWSDGRRTNAVSKLGLWLGWLARHDIDLLDADAADLTQYLTERKAARIKPSTRHDDYRFVRDFYRWAAGDRRTVELDSDPMDTVKAPHVPERPATRAARPGEIETIEDYFMALARTTRKRSGGERERALRNAAMVSVMFRSGLRSVEVAKLDLADYGEHPDWGVGVQIDDPKNDEPRFAPLESRSQGFLEAYLRVRGGEPGPLFRGREAHTDDPDGRLKPRAVQLVVRRAAVRCGVPVSSHQLRRGFVADYIRRGGDALTLKQIGGWVDPRMPHRYFAADQATTVAVGRFRELMDDRPLLRAVGNDDPAPLRPSRNPNLRRR